MASSKENSGDGESLCQGVSMKRASASERTETQVKRINLDASSEVEGGETVRRKRRKYALLLSYSGKGYLGMQRNPGYRTIEDDLLTAMLRADLITDEGCTCPQMFHFQRAARTDKGVSAARQVVSLKLPEDVPDIAGAINGHLCSQIRVMAIRRTTKSFNCKSWCDSRTYSYLCPTFAFAPVTEMRHEGYRITSEVLEQLKTTLSLYKGTHNFHNFTARKKAQDASANRYIMDIDCGQPFEREGLEWITIKIKGQSFMMHQIRKMIGLTMAVTQGLANADIITRAWGKDRVDVPIAPGIGLVLEEPHYDKYNKRYGSDGIHEPLNWDEAAQKIQEFRELYIDSSIVKTEIKEKPMLKWLATLPLHNFNISEASNGNDDQLESSNGRTPLGRAASRLENYRGAGHQDKGSDDEAEDEDEGDLEQYRVVPVMKVAEAAPHGTEQCINGTNTHIVNGVERDDASIIKTGKIISNGDEEQSPDTKDHYTENIG
ncbi:tRNA pseudouridine synthase A-like isoform X2 [Homarus americanus]|nr:tRNA pseudouridine synthase A-like isoform X2 [Homarus americanus]XP_042222990.1 tRNA pseudouridine synthase A-like isoform X2 [Homarus americanus]XP_042222991.1 tRNA pseudouridine synthase A-like isoform X2 [Homarus americanus]